VKQFQKEATSGNYDNLIQTCMKYFEVKWQGSSDLFLPQFKKLTEVEERRREDGFLPRVGKIDSLNV
jgi:hypothetical protein